MEEEKNYVCEDCGEETTKGPGTCPTCGGQLVEENLDLEEDDLGGLGDLGGEEKSDEDEEGGDEL